jgi:short-subunit dehydrogenase
MNLKQKYGDLALVAGASEGLGAAFSTYLAAAGMNLILIARRKDALNNLADKLIKNFGINVQCIDLDLAGLNAAQHILETLQGKEINLMVYNAALSYIGPFEKNSAEQNNLMVDVNIKAPMNLVYACGKQMLEAKKGAIILMSSLAGFQGSGFLATYAATKAFNRILAQSLWYEWKDKGVDVIACCAGATSTPNFINSNPEKNNLFAPKIQSPEQVVKECFEQLGKHPSCITGRGNRIASFIMQKLLPRKMAVKIMGDTTKRMYRLS